MWRSRTVEEDNSQSPRFDLAGMASIAIGDQQLIPRPATGVVAGRPPRSPCETRCLVTTFVSTPVRTGCSMSHASRRSVADDLSILGFAFGLALGLACCSLCNGIALRNWSKLISRAVERHAGTSTNREYRAQSRLHHALQRGPVLNHER